VLKKILEAGEGEKKPKDGVTVKCDYTGTLLDGTKFDSSRDRGQEFEFQLGSGVIQGWSDGVATMVKGERAMFEIVASKAYGARFSNGILHSRSAVEFHAVAPLKALAMCVAIGILLGFLLPLTVATVQTSSKH
jgi:FK506-binding protein 4/5